MIRFACCALLLIGFAPLAHAEGSRQSDAVEIIIPNEEWRKFAYETWHYAPAVKIGDQLIMSGIIASPVDGDLEAGFARAWEQLDEVIKAAGGSGLDDIVEFTSFHVGITDHLEAFARVKDRYIKAPYPAWTAIGTPSLALPQGVVEIRPTVLLSPAD